MKLRIALAQPPVVKEIGKLYSRLSSWPEAIPPISVPDPHLTQRLSRMGAGIIFHAVNISREESPFSQCIHWNFHDANLRMRARAGKI